MLDVDEHLLRDGGVGELAGVEPQTVRRRSGHRGVSQLRLVRVGQFGPLHLDALLSLWAVEELAQTLASGCRQRRREIVGAAELTSVELFAGMHGLIIIELSDIHHGIVFDHAGLELLWNGSERRRALHTSASDTYSRQTEKGQC